MMINAPLPWLAPFLFVLCVTSQEALAELRVVATLPDLGSIAESIGGNRIDVVTLARPTEDPHFVDPRPSLIVKLNRADVLLEGGAGLEVGWLPPLVKSARNSRIAEGSPGRVHGNHGVAMLEIPEELDRSQGDVHAEGNPHYLMDPRNARIVAKSIAETFCTLDPEGCETYRSNLADFEAKLTVKLAEWQQLLAPYRGHHLVSYHDSWPYFSARFGVKVDLFLEPKPGIPPSPAHLAKVIETMKEQKIRVVLVEPFLNRRTAETVARNANATLLRVSQFPGGIKGGSTDYLEHMDTLVMTILSGLSGSQ